MTGLRILTPYERTQLSRYAQSVDSRSLPPDIPIEYITGKVEFCDLVFSISPDALIPRIETEELVHRARKELALLLKEVHAEATLVVADVGTGCGAVIITLASTFQQYSSQVRYLASDISSEALVLAQKNAKDILSEAQVIEFFSSDLLTDYPSDLKFDLLIANLPYIPHDRIAFLDSSVNAYEPHLALDGGTDGLMLIKAFLRQATARMRAKGVIFLEIDYTHTAADFNEFRKDWLISVDTDSSTRNRFARLERK